MENNQQHQDETYAVFALPEDYAYHIGQVVSLGANGLRVARKQLSLSTPYRLDVIPLARISHALYDAKLAPMRIVFGVAMLLLLAAILYYLGVYWDELEPGTTIKVGLLSLAGIYGFQWAFMSRRHRITFHLHDGTRVRWHSRSGDFKYKTAVVERAVGRLKEMGLLPVVSAGQQ